jgi:ubiquitin-conjugating enzyme E2 J1
MDTDAKGQLGGIECSRDARERMAKDSGAWKCPSCGKSNAEIMQEREEMVKEIDDKEGKRKEDHVPEELRLAYRDELGKKEEGEEEPKVDKGKGRAVDDASATSPVPPVTVSPAINSTPSAPVAPAPVVRPTRTRPAPPPQQVEQRSPDLAWIDTCIYGVVAALLFMVLKRFV